VLQSLTGRIYQVWKENVGGSALNDLDTIWQDGGVLVERPGDGFLSSSPAGSADEGRHRGRRAGEMSRGTRAGGLR